MIKTNFKLKPHVIFEKISKLNPLEKGKLTLEETQDFHHLVHRWGCSISEAILDSSSHYFYIPEIEGFIGYCISHQCAIVLGDPVCPEEKKPLLAQAFYTYCKNIDLSVIYFISSEKFSQWAIQNICKILIEVGEEAIFDPFSDPTIGPKAAKLRNTIHHAQHLGLTVEEYLSPDAELEKSILKVGEAWVKARRGPQIYLGDLNFFENRHNHRWFYLQDASKNIIGMSLLSRLDAYQGWLLKFLIIKPEAPRGASELLMISILETLRKEDCHYLTYGMIPADYLGEIIGLNTFSKNFAKMIFKIAKWMFNLGQRKIYWKKFHPHSEKAYILFSNPKISIKELLAISKAMKIDY